MEIYGNVWINVCVSQVPLWHFASSTALSHNRSLWYKHRYKFVQPYNSCRHSKLQVLLKYVRLSNFTVAKIFTIFSISANSFSISLLCMLDHPRFVFFSQHIHPPSKSIPTITKTVKKTEIYEEKRNIILHDNSVPTVLYHGSKLCLHYETS